MKKVVFVLLGILILGCAKLTVGTKDPIKVDINMRVDVYQHVAEDAASINSQIYGDDKLKKLNWLFFYCRYVYAADTQPQVDAAIGNRKERSALVEGYMQVGYIGENKDALLKMLEQNTPVNMRREIGELVSQENRDRMVIYGHVADKNKVSLDAVQTIFFKQDYKIASRGAWFQVYSEEKHGYIWTQK